MIRTYCPPISPRFTSAEAPSETESAPLLLFRSLNDIAPSSERKQSRRRLSPQQRQVSESFAAEKANYMCPRERETINRNQRTTAGGWDLEVSPRQEPCRLRPLQSDFNQWWDLRSTQKKCRRWYMYAHESATEFICIYNIYMVVLQGELRHWKGKCERNTRKTGGGAQGRLLR